MTRCYTEMKSQLQIIPIYASVGCQHMTHCCRQRSGVYQNQLGILQVVRWTRPKIHVLGRIRGELKHLVLGQHKFLMQHIAANIEAEAYAKMSLLLHVAWLRLTTQCFGGAFRTETSLIESAWCPHSVHIRFCE